MDAPTPAARIDEASFTARRREVAFLWSEFMVPYLLRLHRAFDGDVAAAIVLGEIAQRNVSRYFQQLPDGALADDMLGDPQRRRDLMRPCNALSVAESTGIPRETVRRKVNKLIARGWVERDADGCLYVCPGVADHFRDFNFTTLNSLFATMQRIMRCLDASPDRQDSGPAP